MDDAQFDASDELIKILTPDFCAYDQAISLIDGIKLGIQSGILGKPIYMVSYSKLDNEDIDVAGTIFRR